MKIHGDTYIYAGWNPRTRQERAGRAVPHTDQTMLDTIRRTALAVLPYVGPKLSDVRTGPIDRPRVELPRLLSKPLPPLPTQKGGGTQQVGALTGHLLKALEQASALLHALNLQGAQATSDAIRRDLYNDDNFKSDNKVRLTKPVESE